jgi:small conductance mechanosensitive channel
MENIEQVWEQTVVYLTEYGLNVLGAFGILIVGWIAAGWLSKKVHKRAEKSATIDATLTPLLAKVTKVLVLLVTALAVLNQFGIQTTSLVAIMGAAGLAIGLAWQGTLADIASGVMLLVMRPFNVGDSVDIGGESGVVQEIGLVVTKINTFDNVAIVMPNSNVWGDNIKNMSANDNRRVDMVVGFGYDDDMDLAMGTIKEILDKDDRVLDEPEPQIAISDLGDNAVGMIVRPWTKKEDYWDLKFDLTKRIKEVFDEKSISFPYPQRDVHLFQQ